MQIKRYYTDDLKNQRFDVIIVGSGISSLSTAAFLVREGKKVLVIEKHNIIGGYAHTFQRRAGDQKFEWDIGLHYVGMGNEDNAGARRVMDYLTDREIQWTDMGQVYDVAIIAGDRYEFVAGRDNQISNLIRYFPDEEKAIRAYYDLVEKCGTWSVMYFAEKTMPTLMSKTVGHFLRKDFNKQSRRTTYDVLRDLTQNEKLISVLTAQCGNYGLPPRRSSFVAQAIITDHYLVGGCYPVGGSSAIVEAMVQQIERAGSRVIANCGVSHVIVEKNRAIGVALDNGEDLYANIIVSGVGARITFNKLVPLLSENKKLNTLRQKLDKIKASTAHIGLSVGLSGSTEELGLPRHNVWEYDSYDIDGTFDSFTKGESDLPPMRYYSFPSAKDSAWRSAHPGTSSVQIIMLCDYEHFRKWEHTKWQQRGAEYEQYKEELAQKLLKKLYKLYPKTEGRVIISDLSTPLSSKHFNHNPTGEIYGLAHTPERFDLRELRISTPIENLLLTGQDTMCVGIGAAVAAGMLTASLIAKKNLLNTVQEHMKQSCTTLSKSPALRLSEALIKIRKKFPHSDVVY
jgi:all-trans-retinol 13,14-reductase